MEGLPKALVFDWDNTLVDSWVMIHRALERTFIAMGRRPWTLDEAKRRVRASARDAFPKLFTQHDTLSPQPPGDATSTGVGLALCKQLIKLDEGSIGARNNPEAGSTFWISLPIPYAW